MSPSQLAGCMVLGLVALTPATAAGSNWCDHTLIAFAPTHVPVGRETTFTVQVHNTGPNTITLATVQVQFPWEGTYRDAGSGAISAGQTAYYTATVSPPQAGQGPVEVRISGTSSGDPAGTPALTCNTTFGLQIASTRGDPGFEAPALALAFLAVVVVARWRRR